MDKHLEFTTQKRLERVKLALERNNMQAYILQNTADVVPFVRTLVPEGSSVSNGGGMSLAESGVLQLLDSGSYTYLNRDAPGVNRSEVMHKALSVEYFFTSASAVTEQGEILNIDGGGNRVAAIAYGPKRVIFVVGYNKIVPNLQAAHQRLETIARPTNCRRLNLNTPCVQTGKCENCNSTQRICNIELVLRRQMKDNRIHVLLVAQELGY